MKLKFQPSMQSKYQAENWARNSFPIALLIIAMLALSPLLHAQIAGGYVVASPQNKDVVKAAKFAVATEQAKGGKRLTFRSVLQAQTQVVAGLNYKICIKVKEQGKVKTAEAVVYRNLENVYALTSWEWKDCK